MCFHSHQKKNTSGAGDDYINASRVNELCSASTKLIVTQLPTAASLADFVAMIVQEKTAIVVTIANERLFDGEDDVVVEESQQQQQQQRKSSKCPRFWPAENEEKVRIGPFSIQNASTPRERRCRGSGEAASTTAVATASFVERDLSIKFQNKEHSMTQFHLTSWPTTGLPSSSSTSSSSPLELLAFVNEINAHFFKLRVKTAPIVVQVALTRVFTIDRRNHLRTEFIFGSYEVCPWIEGMRSVCCSVAHVVRLSVLHSAPLHPSVTILLYFPFSFPPPPSYFPPPHPLSSLKSPLPLHPASALTDPVHRESSPWFPPRSCTTSSATEFRIRLRSASPPTPPGPTS